MSEVGFSIHWTAAQGNVLALILGIVLVPLLSWWCVSDMNESPYSELSCLAGVLFGLTILAFVLLILAPLTFLWGAKL